MGNNSVQNRISAFSVLLPALVSLFVTTGINIDPVNLPKMVLIASGAGYIFGLLVTTKFRYFIENRSIACFVSALILGLVISTLASNSPFEQLLYGSFGRNTGLITYLSLIVILVSVSTIKNIVYFNNLVIGLFFAGIFNSFYGILQINNLDPIDWTNNFNAIIGTFGNPNFSSAFISISIISYPYIYSRIKSRIGKMSLFAGLILSLFAIVETKSQQGYFLPIAGFGFLFLIYLFKKYGKFWGILGIITSFIGFVTALLGFLQRGPLSSLLYQPSISLRGFYWDAGISMFKSSVFFGNGLDSYGDLYLRNRSGYSVLPPGGENVFSNASHNVFIDLAASGGLFVLIPYLSIIIYAGYLAIKAISKMDFNLLYSTIFVMWIGFLLQSMISINQIGLAVWVWCLTGAVISGASILLNNTKEEVFTKNQTKKNKKQETTAGAFLIGFISTVVFFVIVIPEQIADMNYKSAMSKKDVAGIQNIVNSYPLNSERLSRTSQIFLRSSLNSEALTTSLEAIKFNPNHLNSWVTLLSNPLASREQKILAKNNLIRLDPHSTQWKKIEIK